MTPFTYHTHDTAPEKSSPVLTDEFIPNLHAVMAESPETLTGYKAIWGLLTESSLTPLEQQVVMMTSNFENNCHYCVPWHSYFMAQDDMPREIIEALRNGTVIADARLESLRTFTRELLEHRGHVGDERLQAFFDAGYTHRHALEVILGLAVKLLSNFTNAIAHTVLDDEPGEYVWTKPEPEADLSQVGA